MRTTTSLRRRRRKWTDILVLHKGVKVYYIYIILGLRITYTGEAAGHVAIVNVLYGWTQLRWLRHTLVWSAYITAYWQCCLNARSIFNFE